MAGSVPEPRLPARLRLGSDAGRAAVFSRLPSTAMLRGSLRAPRIAGLISPAPDERPGNRNWPRAAGSLSRALDSALHVRRGLQVLRLQGSLQTAQQQHRGIGYITPSLGRKGIPVAPGDCLLIPKPGDSVSAEQSDIFLGYGSHEIGVIMRHYVRYRTERREVPLLEFFFRPGSRCQSVRPTGGGAIPPNSGVLRS